MNTIKMNMKKLICGTLTALVACTSWAMANVTWSLGGSFDYEPAAGVWVGSSEGGGEQITSGHLYLCFTTSGSGDDMISQLTKSFADGGLEDAGVDAMTTFLAANSQWNGYNANNPNFSANCYSQTGGAFGTPPAGQDSPSAVTINGIDMDKSYDVVAIIFDTQDITADSKYVVIKGFGELDFYMESDKGFLEVGFGTEWYEGDIDHGMAAPNNAVDGQWHLVGIGGETVSGGEEETEEPEPEPEVVEEPEPKVEPECVQLWAGGPYFATKNVGAENPQDYGYYFWWGDTVGYTNTMAGGSSDKKWISVADGKTAAYFSVSKGAFNVQSSYKSYDDLKTLGYIDDVSNPRLNAAHDAATVHWGSAWRMMTAEDITALLDNTVQIYTNNWEGTGMSGWVLKGKNEGYTDKSIFLPFSGSAAGDVIKNGSHDTSNPLGYIWSSTPSSSDMDNSRGQALYLRNTARVNRSNFARQWGCAVRAVRDTIPAPKFAVAIAEGITGGTVTADNAKAAENDTVTLTVTPAEDYEFDTLEVYKTDDPTTKVTVTDGAFTMPAYAVTVSATFVAVTPAEPEPEVEEPAAKVYPSWENGEIVLWEGEAVADGWKAQSIYLAEGGATLSKAEAYVGQEIRFYITPTGDWNYTGNQSWTCDIVGGGWSGVYAQHCGLGCYWDGAPERTEWDLQGNGGYVSFTLTQEMLDAASSKNPWDDVFMANGDKTIITKIALAIEDETEAKVYPSLEGSEIVLWEGNTAVNGWNAQSIFLADGGATLSKAEPYEGQELRFYITPTGDVNYTGNRAWACDIVGGNWSPTYISNCGPGCYWDGAPDRTEWNLDEHGGYVSVALTQEMINAIYEKSSWDEVFKANGDNTIVTKIALAVEEEPEPVVIEVPFTMPFYNGGIATNGIAYWKTYTERATVVNSRSLRATWGVEGADTWYVVTDSDVQLKRGVTCKGNVHLILAPGAKLTANGFGGAGIETDEAGSFTVYGTKDGAGELVAIGSAFAAGIGGGDNCGNGCNITINGGTVTATGACAGIGGGHAGNSRNIVINGGTVTATSTNAGAGIGGAPCDGDSNSFYGGNASDIVINGGMVTATGNGTGAGIGSYHKGSVSNITINGGTVVAIGDNGGAGIGTGGSEGNGRNITINGGTVTATGGYNAAGIGSTNGTAFEHIVIAGGVVTANGGEYAAGIGSGSSYCSDIQILGGAVVAIGGEGAPAIGAYVPVGGSASDIFVDEALLIKADNTYLPTTPLANDGGDLTTLFADKKYVTIASVPVAMNVSYVAPAYADGVAANGLAGWMTNTVTATTVVTSPLQTVWGADGEESWYVVADSDVLINGGVVCKGNVNLILAPGAKLTAKVEHNAGDAGIRTDAAGSFTVYGTPDGAGELVAIGADGGAGIGGKDGFSYADGGVAAAGQNITINGGTVTAKGGELAAGIGGGSNGNGSNIVINSGTVTAMGGVRMNPYDSDNGAGGAGIGGGSGAGDAGGDGTDIVINGGTVTASAELAAGIGGGQDADGSRITINGGTVTATGCGSSGIGGGLFGDGSYITINGGTVTATDRDSGAGIGGGLDGEGSYITINGGVVSATGSIGIGGGCSGEGSYIEINGGTVTAMSAGGEFGTGIGGGYDSSHDIYVNVALLVKAGNTNPATIIMNDGSDLTAALTEKQYVTVGPEGIQVGDNVYAIVEDGVCTLFGTGATWSDKRIGNFVDRNTVTSVVIADGVTEITQRFFKECYFLGSVTGGKDLTTLGKNAFYLCMRLETINLDCTTIPAGLDESVVYRTAINSNSGAGYTIPAITVANHQRMLRGKKALADATWTDLGSPEGQNLFETGYNFFKIDLVEIAADVNGSEDAAAGTDGMIAVNDAEDDSRGGSDAPAWGEFD